MLKAIPRVPRRLTRRLTGAVGEGLAAFLSSAPDPALGLAEELQGTIEHPWAFQQIQALGEELTIVEVGSRDPGLHLTLAQAGHRVLAVGMPETATRGTVLGLPAEAVHGAGIPSASIDVFVSIRGLEHLPGEQAVATVEAGRRLLRPGGHLVLTTTGEDVAPVIDAFDAELLAGELVRREGFADLRIDPLAGGPDPFARCFVARKR